MKATALLTKSCIKCICLITAYFLKCTLLLAQFPLYTEIAHNNLVLRIELNKASDQSYQLKLTKVAGEGLDMKPESILYIHNWDEQVYKAVMPELLKRLSDNDQAYESWNDKNEFTSKLQATFKYFDEKISQSKVENLLIPNYGLTAAEVKTVMEKSKRMTAVWDSMMLVKKVISFQKDSIKREKQRDIEHFRSINKGKDVKQTDIDSISEKHDNTPVLQINERLYEKLVLENKLLKGDLRRINSKRKFVSSLVGNSNVVASFRTIERSEVNAGFGVMARKTGFADFIGILTVAESNDALVTGNKELFGQSILVPGVSKFSLLTSYRSYAIFRSSNRPFFKKLGIGADVNITPYQWTYTEDTTSVSANVVPYAINIVFPYTWILESSDDKHFLISTELGLAVRYIGGSIRKDDIKLFLGNDKRGYWGPVAGISIQYNALRAQFHAPLLVTNKQVKGLTNGQVYASIGIVGSLISDITGVIRNSGK